MSRDEDVRAPGPSFVLRAQGLRPRKGLGQNFLRDRRFLGRILEVAQLSANDVVLEIGPGTGELTREAAGRAGRVVAVELDSALADLLRCEFEGVEHVEIVQGDALEVDPCSLFDGDYKLLGNIPYYITGPLLRHFLESACPPSLLIMMVQREVAQRIVAGPGDMSLLGVSVQRYARPEIVARVPAGAFYPAPKVESAILRLVPLPSAPSAADSQDFFTVVRSGFGLKRKQLVNSLSAGLDISKDETRRLLASAGITPSRRAESLSLEEWEGLTRAWRDLDEKRAADAPVSPRA